MGKMRIESDSMGELNVPFDALYGAQTQRAVNNFPISHQTLPKPFILALLKIKLAAARANSKLKMLDKDIAQAIEKACLTLIDDPNVMAHFPVDVFQTGSGTSTNMNANEVIATVAMKSFKLMISPNDHVNCGQSSNDVIPTTIHVSAAILLNDSLIPAITHAMQVTSEKAVSVQQYIKTGRTHLMDAMPVSMAQPLNAWVTQLEQQLGQFNHLRQPLQTLAQGGTAVGSGVNAHPHFARSFCEELNKLTTLSFQPSNNFFTHISSQDTAVVMSGQLKALAVSVMKIANDLRWMNSGPLAGLGEISLEALQPGSSIMPGKVNPVIPEAAAMVCAQAIGNDTAITIAGQSGNFELNVMLPLIAKNLIDTTEQMANVIILLADKAIKTFTVNEKNLQRSLVKNPMLVTALNPVIGYLKAAEIAKIAYEQDEAIIEVALRHTQLSRQALTALLDPARLTNQ